MNNINDFPVQVRFPIAWGEMDVFDHVNNVSYFRYFENARIKYFDEVGLLELKRKTGMAPVLAESNCKYLQSVKYPDNLIVGARVKSVGQTSFIQDYLIFSEKLGAAALGKGVLVMYDFNTSQKVSVPEEVRTAIQELEKRPVGTVNNNAHSLERTYNNFR